MEKEKLAYEEKYKGFNVQCWYLLGKEGDAGDALIRITRGRKLVRKFLFPAYKVWNIAAHFSEIVESELAGDIDGYGNAASAGIGGSVFGIREVK